MAEPPTLRIDFDTRPAVDALRSLHAVRPTGAFPVTDELMLDFGYPDYRAFLADAAAAAFEELRLDLLYGRGTHHRPGRAELRAILRPERVRRNIRRNLDWAGLGNARWGIYRRAAA